LSQRCPEPESHERWACACGGIEQFAQQWAAKAKNLGWTFDELFALHEPFANVSLRGAAWFIGDSSVTAVTADAITLRTDSGATQRAYRENGRPADLDGELKTLRQRAELTAHHRAAMESLRERHRRQLTTVRD
jgi:hypothetical protein